MEQKSIFGNGLHTDLREYIDMLGTEPVVFFFSLWVAFAWGVLYIQFGAIPLVFKKVYSFNAWQCGLVFSCEWNASIGTTGYFHKTNLASSYLCWHFHRFCGFNLPREVIAKVLATKSKMCRRSSILVLHSVDIPTNWSVLVWLVSKNIDLVVVTRASHWPC